MGVPTREAGFRPRLPLSGCLDFTARVPGAGTHLRVPALESRVVESSSLGKEPPPAPLPLSRARNVSLQKLPDERP